MISGNRQRLIFAVLILMGIGFVTLARHTVDEYILAIINFVGIYIILAVSLNITNGFAGLFSLGHPGFMAIGGYVTAILTFPVSRKSMFLELPQWLANLQLPFFPALIIGGACAGITAVAVGLPALTNLWWVYPWVVVTIYVSWKIKFSSSRTDSICRP